MSMKLTRLRTYWDADDAYLVLSFLSDLSDVLWDTYGAEIIEQQQQENHPDDQQLPLEIEEIPIE